MFGGRNPVVIKNTLDNSSFLDGKNKKTTTLVAAVLENKVARDPPDSMTCTSDLFHWSTQFRKMFKISGAKQCISALPASCSTLSAKLMQ